MAGSPSAVQGSEPSLSSPRQSRTNGFVSHSRATVVCPMWPGLITQAGVEHQQAVHDRAAQVLEARGRGAADAAHGAGEERVAREALGAVDDEREHAVGVAGRVQGLDAQVAALDDVALRERPVGTARQARCLEGVRQHGRIGVALAHRVEVRDVVAVVVGDQDVRDLQAMAVDGGDDRLRRAAGVDEDGAATGVVADDVGVGEPPGLHAALEDHAGQEPSDPRE